MYRVTGNYARNFHPSGVLSRLYCLNDVTKRAPRMADGSVRVEPHLTYSLSVGRRG
jgi:hypothetical protein